MGTPGSKPCKDKPSEPVKAPIKPSEPIKQDNGPKNCKICIVGKTYVGKTCLIWCYNNDTFCGENVPNACVDVYEAEKKNVKYSLIDTSGDPEKLQERQ